MERIKMIKGKNRGEFELKKADMIEKIDLREVLLYMFCNVKGNRSYTRLHQIAFLLKKWFDEKGESEISERYTFEQHMFGQPYDRLLQERIEELGECGLLYNQDKEVSPGSLIDTHIVQITSLGKSYSRYVGIDLKKLVGKNDFKEFRKYIKELNRLPEEGLANRIEELGGGPKETDYVGLDKVPQDLVGILKRILEEETRAKP